MRGTTGLTAAAIAAALGLPGVAPAGTGACCAGDGACTLTAPAECPAPARYFAGTPCSAMPCGTLVGACCSSTGACTLQSGAQCAAGGGVYRGDMSSCTTAGCPVPTGACCTSTGGCWTARLDTCLGAGGAFVGDWVACGPAGQCPLGACCLPAGGCTAGVSEAQCSGWQGAFRGVGSTCATTVCPEPTGACCNQQTCLAMTRAFCQFFGGVWTGPGTACVASACSGPPGVCCRGSTCAAGVPQAICTAPAARVGASFKAGPEGDCSATPSPCCHADFNKSGAIDLTDIFDFLNAWFASSPYAQYAGDGTGVPTLPDIFAFLNAWFARAC